MGRPSGNDGVGGGKGRLRVQGIGNKLAGRSRAKILRVRVRTINSAEIIKNLKVRELAKKVEWN